MKNKIMNDVFNFMYCNIIFLCNKFKKIIVRKVFWEYYLYFKILFENEKEMWVNFIKNKLINWMFNIFYYEFIIYFIKMLWWWNVIKFIINVLFCNKLKKKMFIKIFESRGLIWSYVYIIFFFLKCNYCYIV